MAVEERYSLAGRQCAERYFTRGGTGGILYELLAFESMDIPHSGMAEAIAFGNCFHFVHFWVY